MSVVGKAIKDPLLSSKERTAQPEPCRPVIYGQRLRNKGSMVQRAPTLRWGGPIPRDELIPSVLFDSPKCRRSILRWGRTHLCLAMCHRGAAFWHPRPTPRPAWLQVLLAPALHQREEQTILDETRQWPKSTITSPTYRSFGPWADWSLSRC